MKSDTNYNYKLTSTFTLHPSEGYSSPPRTSYIVEGTDLPVTLVVHRIPSGIHTPMNHWQVSNLKTCKTYKNNHTTWAKTRNIAVKRTIEDYFAKEKNWNSLLNEPAAKSILQYIEHSLINPKLQLNLTTTHKSGHFTMLPTTQNQHKASGTHPTLKHGHVTISRQLLKEKKWKK